MFSPIGVFFCVCLQYCLEPEPEPVSRSQRQSQSDIGWKTRTWCNCAPLFIRSLDDSGHEQTCSLLFLCGCGPTRLSSMCEHACVHIIVRRHAIAARSVMYTYIMFDYPYIFYIKPNPLPFSCDEHSNLHLYIWKATCLFADTRAPHNLIAL